jgi:hypothetical protein
MRIRRSDDRGTGDHGWLHSRHTFSFADYHDQAHMGFRTLRVINEDRVQPGRGFGTHPHRDMEIISYVLDGALEHADSMGNGSIIRPGDVQRMSAGTGVTHSEYNHSRSEPVHFLQIWIQPAERGIEPGYEQKTFPPEDRRDRLRLVASPDGADGSVTLHQDARLYVSLLSPGATISFDRPPERHVWLQVARGRVRVGDTELSAGDGLADSDGSTLEITGADDAELLLFDLA